MRLPANWLNGKGPRRVLSMLTEAGHLAYVVGGAVRDSLMNLPVGDIDIATDASPARVLQLAQSSGIKAVPTGLDHGTVTLIHGGPIEVTTLRKDIETDGRRAVVAFATSIEEDAARRDFTMNALYASPDGEILDPIGGLADVAARRVRFIGAASDRIREDYLRSLRYFRFYARYADASLGPDPDALDAIAANLPGLDTLSAERVGAEVRKLLGADDPAPAVGLMAATGVLAAILPGADHRALAPLVHLEKLAGVAPEPIRRLAALGGEDVPTRLRLSRAEAKDLQALRDAVAMTPGEAGYRLGEERGRDAVLLAGALSGVPTEPARLAEVTAGARARFPVAARDLSPLTGSRLGARLKELEGRWIASGFALGKEELLS